MAVKPKKQYINTSLNESIARAPNRHLVNDFCLLLLSIA